MPFQFAGVFRRNHSKWVSSSTVYPRNQYVRPNPIQHFFFGVVFPVVYERYFILRACIRLTLLSFLFPSHTTLSTSYFLLTRSHLDRIIPLNCSKFIPSANNSKWVRKQGPTCSEHFQNRVLMNSINFRKHSIGRVFSVDFHFARFSSVWSHYLFWSAETHSKLEYHIPNNTPSPSTLSMFIIDWRN